MVKTSQIRAFKKFGVGYFITEQMKFRNIKHDELADYIGITPQHLKLIMHERLALNIEVGCSLGKIFNTSAQYWINLDEGSHQWAREKK